MPSERGAPGLALRSWPVSSSVQWSSALVVRPPGGRSDQPSPEVMRVARRCSARRPASSDYRSTKAAARGDRVAPRWRSSPDGRSLVFSAIRGSQQQLYLRPLTRARGDADRWDRGGHSPFFSPDGRWLGFWVAEALSVPGSLLKMAFPPGWAHGKDLRCAELRGRRRELGLGRHDRLRSEDRGTLARVGRRRERGAADDA